MRRLLGSWFKRHRFEAELDEELEFHVVARRDDLVRQGLAPEAAERRARVELGMRESYKEAVRQDRGLLLWESLVGDLRYAARGLWRSRGFTATVLLVLGLAIGVNVALFSLARGYLFGGVASRAGGGSGALVDVTAHDLAGGVRQSFFLAEFDVLSQALAQHGRLWAIDEVRIPAHYADGADPEQGRPPFVYGRVVSASYFPQLGVPMALGRPFDADFDRRDDGEAPVVLSHLGWRRLLAGDPQAVGRRIRLGDSSYVVVGVAAASFTGLEPVVPAFWMPLAAHRSWLKRQGREEGRYLVEGRLSPATTAEQASAMLSSAVAQLSALRAPGQDPYDPLESVESVRATARLGMIPRADANRLLLASLPIAVGFFLVLLVACANLANLSLARAAAREREIAVRLSLGASRARLVRQLLTESVTTALVAAGGSLAVAALGMWSIQTAAFAKVAQFGVDPVAVLLDGWSVALAAALGVVAGVAYGLSPALAATVADRGGRDTARRGLAAQTRTPRTRRALLIGQIAASLVLLVLASLVFSTSRRADEIEIGYDVDRIVDVGAVDPSPELFRRLREDPGFAGATAVSHVPLIGRLETTPVRVGSATHSVGVRAVDEAFFGLTEIRLLRGRGFRGDEASGGAPVAVVSASTAARLWPGQDPLEQFLEVPPSEGGDADVLSSLSLPLTLAPGRYAVIGVAADVVSGWFFRGTDPTAVYVPAAQGSGRVRDLLVRVRNDVPEALRRLRRLCAETERSGACEPVPLSGRLGLQRVPFRVATDVAAGLGLAAALITAIGLYGVIAFQVARRVREMGVRAALGASRRSIVALVLRGASRQVVIGLLAGLPFCLAVSWLIRAKLEGFTAFDLRGYLAVPVGLWVLAMAAVLAPALRAARVDPMVALREE